MSAEKDQKWLEIAIYGAKKMSTCGKRQYMAFILDADGHVVSTGYNGGPPGSLHCIDGGCERLKVRSAPGSSYDNCIAIHAEQNALVRADHTRCKGGTIYVGGPPCYQCAKMIANSGLSRVVFTFPPDYDHSYWENVWPDLTNWGVELQEIPWSSLEI